jgi:hypothetical protein
VVSQAALAHEDMAWYSTVRQVPPVGFTNARGAWPAIGYPSAWLGPLSLGGLWWGLQDGGYFGALGESSVLLLVAM